MPSVCMLCCVGTKGMAYTLVTAKDKDFAGHLVRNLEGANQYVPQELLDLALQVRCAPPLICLVCLEQSRILLWAFVTLTAVAM